MSVNPLVLISAVLAVLVVGPVVGAQDSQGVQPDAKAAQILVVQVCQGCHGPETLSQKGRSKVEWATVVQTMIERGAMASDQDLQTIIDYLAATYPADPKAAGR